MLGHHRESLLSQGAELPCRVVRLQRLSDLGNRDDLTAPYPVGEHRGRGVHQLYFIGQRDDRRLIEPAASRTIATALAAWTAGVGCRIPVARACRATVAACPRGRRRGALAAVAGRALAAVADRAVAAGAGGRPRDRAGQLGARWRSR